MKKKSNAQIYCCLFIVAVVLLQTSPAQVQQSSSVRITTARQASAIRSIAIDSNQYLSVKELAGFLAVGYYENMVLRKSEIRLPTAILKFTADNPFVVQTNPETKRSHVHQLSQPVIVHDGHFFVFVPEITLMIKTLHDS